MLKATKIEREIKVIQEEKIILEMTIEEATALRTLLFCHVCGHINTPRSDLDRVSNRLESVSVPYYKLDSGRVLSNPINMDMYMGKVIAKE